MTPICLPKLSVKFFYSPYLTMTANATLKNIKISISWTRYSITMKRVLFLTIFIITNLIKYHLKYLGLILRSKMAANSILKNRSTDIFGTRWAKKTNKGSFSANSNTENLIKRYLLSFLTFKVQDDHQHHIEKYLKVRFSKPELL